MNQLVTTPQQTPVGSVSNSRANSYRNSGFLKGSPVNGRYVNTEQFTYSFINKEFIDEELMSLGPSSKPSSTFHHMHSHHRHHHHHHHHYHYHNGESFRNHTSTPVRSTPLSLPKSLPIDWNLFNKQYQLKQTALKKRKQTEPIVENNFENLPYQIIDFIADCCESQKDLIALSQTCKFFNKMVNFRLYKKILIIDDVGTKYKHYDSNYTLLDIKKNYPKLLASLHSNSDSLIPLIREIIIDTSGTANYNQSYDLLNNNVYDALYDLFLTNNNNLQRLENLDLNNLRKFGSLLSYNHDHLIKHNYNKYTSHYDITDNSSLGSTPTPAYNQLNSHIRHDILNLKNFQILDLKDLNNLPTSCESLSILVEYQHQINNPNSQLKLDPQVWQILTNLKELQLNTPTTFDLFLELLQNQQSSLKLNNLTTLSISNIHHDNEPINFNKLANIIDLSTIRNLELKLNCYERVLCNSCILHFLTNWYNQVDIIKLEKLSLISIPPSSQSNFGIQWDSLLTEGNIMTKFFSGLKFFYINLNDFPFVPLFVKTRNFELDHSNALKLPINNVILEKRHEMFDSLIRHLKNVEDLTITDWFYNWLVYLNIDKVNDRYDDVDDDSSLNFINYLNSCTCSECIKGRGVFKELVALTCFKDFKKRFQTDLNYGSSDGSSVSDSSLNLIKENPDQYRILYNHILLSLKNRIPLNSQSSKISTSLKLDSFKQINELSTQLIDKGKWDSILKLLTHSVRPQIKKLVINLPHLKRLNLGGLIFTISVDLETGNVNVRSAYDSYSEVYVK